jgi:excisionase family DNA binding protein
MAMEANGELLTIRETAELLRVSEITVSRWVKQGRLPAMRVGPRAVRIRRHDIERVLEPVTGATAAAELLPGEPGMREKARPSTDEEKRRRLAALDELSQLRQEIRVRRGGRSLPDSAPVIREEREKRTRQILGWE